MPIIFINPNQNAFSCVYIVRALKSKCKEGDFINNLSDLSNLSNMIKLIANGDKTALKNLYDDMNKDIYTFLLIFCKDKYTAEDALQETFISIYENAGSYRTFNNPKAWIFTIAKNKAISIIRKNSRAISIDVIENDITNIADTENIILDKIHADALLSVLSDDNKKIVILHVVYGLKHREIAELMNMPTGTVKWRYKQSIDKMKNIDGEEKNIEVFSELNKQNEVIM